MARNILVLLCGNNYFEQPAMLISFRLFKNEMIGY